MTVEFSILGFVLSKALEAVSLQGSTDPNVPNQRQNVSDVILLLPRLATGIDVNLRFQQ